MNLIGHVDRMESRRKYVFNNNPQRCRLRGRPKKKPDDGNV